MASSSGAAASRCSPRQLAKEAARKRAAIRRLFTLFSCAVGRVIGGRVKPCQRMFCKQNGPAPKEEGASPGWRPCERGRGNGPPGWKLVVVQTASPALLLCMGRPPKVLAVGHLAL